MRKQSQERECFEEDGSLPPTSFQARIYASSCAASYVVQALLRKCGPRCASMTALSTHSIALRQIAWLLARASCSCVKLGSTRRIVRDSTRSAQRREPKVTFPGVEGTERREMG